MNNWSLEEIREQLGIDSSLAEKVMLIEKLTMLAKTSSGNARYENLSSDTDLPGSMNTTAFRLRSLLLSLSEEEHGIVSNYLGGDYWCPSEWSAGSY